MKNVAVRTIANARQDVSELGISDINKVSWFSKLGKPSKWDKDCERIHDWKEWPGPDDERVLNLALHLQAIHDSLKIDESDGLKKLFKQTNDAVVAKASKAVPEYKADEDAWHGPTQCVWDAGYCCGLIVCFLQLGEPVHEDLQELWAWYEAGHWPCGFTNDSESSKQTLMVY